MGLAFKSVDNSYNRDHSKKAPEEHFPLERILYCDNGGGDGGRFF